uniref:Caltractin n=1 Tax=Chlamydomonas euryale TaxID=1486919 RepID=A0A7R9YR83_9CHLO|mmetsp:Transcript_13398/g.38881  ORF Transcript_13398/g.38881 Transcript_13398/m.38881 type:complete len:175 (+) Transcript_13398:77-601(+)
MASVSGNPYATPLFLNPRQERSRGPRELTAEEAEQVQFAFSTLDSEQSGHVSRRQLKVALRAMGFPVKKAEVAEALARHGEPNVEAVGFETFRSVVVERLLQRTPEEEMRRAFQLFDVHGSGKIDAFTLRRVTKSLGMNITDGELNDMIVEFDLDKDGMISEEEFMNVMFLVQE